MEGSPVKFLNTKDPEFIKELRSRVNEYFNSNGISKFGNGQMVFKSIVMLLIFFVPYALVLFSGWTNDWVLTLLWISMGVGMAGIGMSIMHDANHGSYSKNQKLNTLIGHVIFFVGGSSLTWKIQHNHFHHAYTNIHGVDEDIESINILRFSPHQDLKKIHRFQFIYAWFFYGLMTLSRFLVKDYDQIIHYKKMGLVKDENRSFGGLFFRLVMSKLLYAFLIIALPILITDVLWWKTILFFLVMQFTSGFILGIVFQPAHVMPDTKFPLPNKAGQVENNWGIHQLLTTTNFAPKSKLFSWFVGGLNYQIEHHLFPGISHVHYKNISVLVKKTASEYGLPYNSQTNFMMALWNHGKMLYNLGNSKYTAQA